MSDNSNTNPPYLLKAPDALIGMALINAISMVCPGLNEIKLPTGQFCPVTQNLLIVTNPGERKTTMLSLFRKLSPKKERKDEKL